MGSLPTFKCVNCEKKLEIGEVYSIPDETYHQIGYGPVSSIKKYCKECCDEYIGDTSEKEDVLKNDSQKATEKQISFLKILGFAENTNKLTKSQASNTIKGLLKDKRKA